MNPPRTAAVLTACALIAFGPRVRAEPVSFRNDVMAVLSKGGCNQGACHGNQNGKNGFKLSLRGEDPDFDLAILTRDMQGRRVDRLRPAESLLLQKAVATIPHEGGRRFPADSPEYALLRRWISEGAYPDLAGAPVLRQVVATPAEQVLVEPADRVQLRVMATFSDGSVRDVTRLAVYEVSNPSVVVSPGGEVRRSADAMPGVTETSILVRYLNQRSPVQLAFVPARPGFAWQDVPEANYIDHHVFAKLRALRMLPSPLCSDSVFLRRAYLDTLGILPAADEARAFLHDSRPDKRARLIDRLLDGPEFADFWALKWSDVLHNEEKTLDRKGVQLFHQWLRQAILEGRPLNELAREVIAGRGSTYSEPAANFYRALRDPQARAEAAAQVFLGVRLNCAKCHNHPFDRWTQNDYHSWAAFFVRVDYHILENNRRDRFDKHEFDGEQVVYQNRESEVKHPRTGERMRPRFLGGPTPDLGPGADRLQTLADWLARPDNPFFARAQANRVWFHLLGRGLVEPNDDFRASNPPVNAPLLDALATDFAEHRFDLRHLVRTVLNSRTYQLSAVPNETNREDVANSSHAVVRPLQAEQLLDAFAQVTGVPVKFNNYSAGIRAGQLPALRPGRGRDGPSAAGDRFLKQFGKPERLLTCECERSDDVTLGQALTLMTGELLNDLLKEPDNRLGKRLAAGKSDRAILDELYLAALCRLPREKEIAGTLALVARAKDRRAAWEDVLWALLNAKEFVLRQ